MRVSGGVEAEIMPDAAERVRVIRVSEHGTAQESIKGVKAAGQKSHARTARMITIQTTVFPTSNRFRNRRPDCFSCSPMTQSSTVRLVATSCGASEVLTVPMAVL